LVNQQMSQPPSLPHDLAQYTKHQLLCLPTQLNKCCRVQCQQCLSNTEGQQSKYTLVVKYEQNGTKP
jgi:hypothetical protein